MKKGFWKQRTSFTKSQICRIPYFLKAACEEYFTWCEDNPLYEAKFVFSETRYLEKPRAMTLAGLCIFLGIDRRTWNRWRKGKDDDFIAVVEWVDEVIRDQKFAGAAVNLFNSNIIMRDLGLVDKTENKNIDVTPTIIEDNIGERKS